MNQKKLDRVLKLHQLWLDGDAKGERANLSYSNLRGSNLSGSNLRDSNLRGSDLSYSDLRGSNLSYSDLRGSNLSHSDLRGSNLSEATYAHCRGNNTTIKTIHCDTYDIAYTDAVMQIGCERYKIADWWKFTDAQIRAMDGRTALDWWKVWSPILRKIIKYSPAENNG